MKKLSDLDETDFQNYRLEKVSSLTNLNHFQRKKTSLNTKIIQKEKPLEEENFKFFHLPANQIEALKKKLKLSRQQKSAPTQEQIKQYLNSHSLRHLIYQLDLETVSKPVSLTRKKVAHQLDSNKSSKVEPFNQGKRLSLNQFKIQYMLNQKKSNKNFQVRKQNFFSQIPKSQYSKILNFEKKDQEDQQNEDEQQFPFEESIVIRQAKQAQQEDGKFRFKRIKKILKQNLLKLKMLGLQPKQVRDELIQNLLATRQQHFFKKTSAKTIFIRIY